MAADEDDEDDDDDDDDDDDVIFQYICIEYTPYQLCARIFVYARSVDLPN